MIYGAAAEQTADDGSGHIADTDESNCTHKSENLA
jgi:hypothetical protein